MMAIKHGGVLLAPRHHRAVRLRTIPARWPGSGRARGCRAGRLDFVRRARVRALVCTPPPHWAPAARPASGADARSSRAKGVPPVPGVRIAAESRTEFGKGAARRTRRAGRVPAIVYGHGTDTRHISLPGHDLMLALKTPNVLIRVD